MRSTSITRAIVLCLACQASIAADPPVRLQNILSGLQQPVLVTHAPGDASRIFIVESSGKIKIMRQGALLPTPFLNVAPRMTGSEVYWLEYGLLGLAFHPDFAHNGYFYVNYTVGTSNLADTAIARYKVSADNPDVADPDSHALILRIPYTRKNHRAGWIDFDSRGYLYVPTGDGGEGDPDVNASNLAVLAGKILRLDVDGPDGVPGTSDDDAFPADAFKNYHIPASNPFVGVVGVAPEIWAYGLRNPWRCSFDRETGDLWIGDVGQSTQEEVDRLGPDDAGANLGWRCMEGTARTTGLECQGVLPPSVPPVHSYGRSIGFSVIGGYVYRGCAMPELRGTYIFGDWQRRAWSFRYAGSVITSPTVRNELLPPLPITSFGSDAFGELYVCSWQNSTPNGTVSKIVPVVAPPDSNSNGIPDSCEGGACPADLDSDGSFSNGGTPDGAVTIEDLLFMLAAFEAGDLAADVDDDGDPSTGAPDGAVTIEDLLFFLARFEVGC